MSQDTRAALERRARFRFAVIGPLLACPPPPGELQRELAHLCARTWTDPVSDQPRKLSRSTVERWYYAARRAADPVKALTGRSRSDRGRSCLPAVLREALRAQHRAHPGWTVQLHYDNLAALVAGDPALGPLPSYATVRRYMRAQAMERSRPPRRRPGDVTPAAPREIRSFEVEHVGGLWHTDFHVGKRQVLTDTGWQRVHLCGVLDDHSRLACHIQWYLAESARALVHDLSQALQKRGMPRALMSDNGSAQTAGEVTEGLARLGIVHETIRPYSAYQNAKMEVFWAQVEGRLMALIEHIEPLTLEELNRITAAWVEMDYNRKRHRELGCAPVERFATGPCVLRECPDATALARAFRRQVTRSVRRADGTLTVAGTRYELPARFCHLHRVSVRHAHWHHGEIDLVDPATGAHLATLYPLDKAKNAASPRRIRASPVAPVTPTEHTSPPLLDKLLADYAATGLPPAYLTDTTEDHP